MSLIKLTGGRVIDPANGVNDQVRDIWVRDGRIVAGPDEHEKVTAEYNIAGRIVMSGAIDIHAISNALNMHSQRAIPRWVVFFFR